MSRDIHRDIFSVAPMVDYTDRHARFLYRLISRHACLYTEMLATNSILHSSKDLLHHPDDTGRIVLQLGGAVPSELSLCARMGEKAGYSAINLNCGCPSDRVVKGGFGVGMMRDHQNLISCLRAMLDSVSIDVTIKHRLGIDYTCCYSMLRDFVGMVADSGVSTFIMHARNAVLERKISPKVNLSSTVLRYDFVYRIKRDFPDLCIIINGHINDFNDIRYHLDHVDGVMLGRKVLKDPWCLHEVDALCDCAKTSPTVSCGTVSRNSVARAFVNYALKQEERGCVASAYHLMRYVVNIMRGTSGARSWRRAISNAKTGMFGILDFLENNSF